MLKLNKGAMFGLDARIALVIFAILGVVGSYYSINYISDVSDDSTIKQIKTLRQAAMQNIADNNNTYKVDDTNLNSDIFGLNNKSASLNRGNNNYSYINRPNTDSTGSKIIISSPSRDIQITANNIYSSELASGESFKTTDCNASETNCYYWLKIDNSTQKIFKLLDQYYDNTTGTFDDTTSVETGIIVAPSIDSANDTAVVLVNIGER